MSERRATAPKACVFDGIIAGASPAHIVFRDAVVVAFLDTRPVFPGHTLVVPVVHHGTVSDLPAGVMAHMWEVAARIAAAQRRALDAEGTFFGLNDVVSQSVPHVHLHVVPRRRGDGLRGFFWPRRTYQDGEAESTAGALRAALSSEAERTPPPAEPGG
jgi:histidine triad (HIT) family protein